MLQGVPGEKDGDPGRACPRPVLSLHLVPRVMWRYWQGVAEPPPQHNSHLYRVPGLCVMPDPLRLLIGAFPMAGRR